MPLNCEQFEVLPQMPGLGVKTSFVIVECPVFTVRG